ncbi:MAG TPA: helix-hairpin-helix domain-containing protein, partial [Thermoanaerobaculia bacterium]|nr:helix-hairpin-helix domain-containing protein [Thermoanaerobaculia bacterium]
MERILFLNEENGWSVVKLAPAEGGEAITVVGHLGDVQPGESLALSGLWQEDRKFGRQFKVDSHRSVLPTQVDAIEKYLGSGLIPGIGKAMARRLVERFGEATLEVIDRYSARLLEVPGIGAKRSAAIREAWVEQREIRAVMLFLQGHGIGTAHALRIWKAYGNAAVAVLESNPYRLAAEIHGIGFKTADQIAARLGLPRDAPERAAAGLLYLLAEASEQGHCFLPRAQLLSRSQELLSLPAAPLETALERLAEGHRVKAEPDEAGEVAIYLPELHRAETGLAEDLARLLRAPGRPLELDLEAELAWFEARERITLAAAQREAIKRALHARVLVVTGGPGTGKTTLVRGIVAILVRRGRQVLLAAPT